MILRRLKTLKPALKSGLANTFSSLRMRNRGMLSLTRSILLSRKVILTTATASSLMFLNLQFSSIRFFSDENLEDLRTQLESHIEKLKSKNGEQLMSFPKPNYRLQGDTYKVDFLVDQRKCDIFSLLVIASNMLENSEKAVNKNHKNSKIFENVKTMDKNGYMTLNLEFSETEKNGSKLKGAINIMGEFRPDRASFKFVFQKSGNITQTDIEIVKRIYEKANENSAYSLERQRNIAANESLNRVQKKDQSTGAKLASALGMGSSKEENETIQKLNEMGIVIFMPNDKKNMQGLAWDMLAGYEKQKRDIEDTILMSLSHPEIYDEITLKTRMRFEQNRAKAVLFEGPPGTGKTTSAKIIASQVGIPLLYMPLESIMSKWYGEAEQKLAEVFEGAGNLGRAIIFIDEIDAIAGGRGG